MCFVPCLLLLTKIVEHFLFRLTVVGFIFCCLLFCRTWRGSTGPKSSLWSLAKSYPNGRTPNRSVSKYLTCWSVMAENDRFMSDRKSGVFLRVYFYVFLLNNVCRFYDEIRIQRHNFPGLIVNNDTRQFFSCFCQ